MQFKLSQLVVFVWFLKYAILNILQVYSLAWSEFPYGKLETVYEKEIYYLNSITFRKGMNYTENIIENVIKDSKYQF